MLLLVGGITLFGDNVRRLFGMWADALAGDDRVSTSGRSGAGDGWALTRKTMAGWPSPPSGDAATSGPSPLAPAAGYGGIAARRELPPGVRRVWLSNEMVDTRAPSAAKVVLISTSVVNTLWAALNVATVAMAFALRRRLVGGLKAQLVRVFGAPPARPEPGRSAAAPADSAPPVAEAV